MNYLRRFVWLGAIALLLAGLSPHALAQEKSSCSSDWTRIPSPSPANQPGDANQLSGISAISPTDAWVVGWSLSFSKGAFRTLAEHWDGNSWKVVPTPNSAQRNNYLNSVFALASDDVWAVGQQDDDEGDQWILVEHWDGKAWTIDHRARVPGSLGDVIAFSPSDVRAAGFTLEHFDGTTWSGRGIGAANYFGDLAGSADDLWAVGYRTVEPIGPVLTFSAHWDGASWTSHGGENPLRSSVDDENVFTGVTVPPGDNNPWAVGYFADFDGGPAARTLIEHWDGAKWNRVPSPSPGGRTKDSMLWDVTAISTTDLWAVGTVGSDGSPDNLTLIEHWDGSSWKVVKTPGPGVLLSVAGDRSTGSLWAVGYTEGSGYQATLILSACGL